MRMAYLNKSSHLLTINNTYNLVHFNTSSVILILQYLFLQIVGRIVERSSKEIAKIYSRLLLLSEAINIVIITETSVALQESLNRIQRSFNLAIITIRYDQFLVARFASFSNWKYLRIL